MTRINLYGTPLSGHMHRVELILLALELPFDFSDAPASVRESAEFRQLNPLGQIPVLQDGDLVLCDSNAIMVYLLKRYGSDASWLREDDPVIAAHIQQWLSISAAEIRYGPSTARRIVQFNYPGDLVEAQLISKQILGVMEDHLQTRNWLAADHRTIADLACYSYVAAAPEGDISLEPYSAIQNWLVRVEALPFFKAMPKAG